MKQFLKQNDCTFDRGVLRNKINNERAKLQRLKKDRLKKMGIE